ncbi:MAG: hypothetical protein IKI33_01965, partial [Eubacterium sp.]|nr:hypothetical protein [Eubacterium sp.]
STPVTDVLDLGNNLDFYKNLIDIMLDGGSFGYLVQSKGFYHYYANNDGSKKVTLFAKLKAALRYVFPPAEYVRSYRKYSQEHVILIPLAYVARMKDAITKRRNLALSTFSDIMNIDDKDLEQRHFIENLDDNSDRS